MQVLIVGGTAGIGRELALSLASQGDSVVVTGRDAVRSSKVAAQLSASPEMQDGTGSVRGMGVDLSRPHQIADAVRNIEHVDAIVLAGMQRDRNTVRDYDVSSATELATIKLVGYTAVAHALYPRLSKNGAILLFGGFSKDVPYPGSTTVSTVNAGVVGLVSTLAYELAPVRVNAIHPGAVEDSPFWAGNEEALKPARERTLTGRLATMRDVVDGCTFLLRNSSANGVNLTIDGGRA